MNIKQPDVNPAAPFMHKYAVTRRPPENMLFSGSLQTALTLVCHRLYMKINA
jgi:hypothetical protein